MSAPFAWAPETVRGPLRIAGFGLGGLVRVGLSDLVWAFERRGTDSSCTGCVVGHRAEVPPAFARLAEGMPTTKQLSAAIAAGTTPCDVREVELSIPSELFDLAEALRVTSWGNIIGLPWVLRADVLGMPVMLVAPLSTSNMARRVRAEYRAFVGAKGGAS